ncbi:MAG TPA: hypothetical protein VFI70_09705 [Nitrososphaeraceae archaeon]|nr:hypothetical protein [Nitrososphaeraceae archaeon]
MGIYGLQYDARDHVLTSEHKQVTITEIIWQNDKALEILRIEIKSIIALHDNNS